MHTHNEFRVAIAVSGGGTTMEAVIKACQQGRLPLIKPVLIIASAPNIGAIDKAQNCGLGSAVHVIERGSCSSDQEFGMRIIELCRKHRVHAFCQYGWMPRTPDAVLDYFDGQMINQHPGGIDTEGKHGDFGGRGMYGKRVIAAQLYFAQTSGKKCCTYAEATAQLVHPQYDRGRVLRAWKVPIHLDDTVNTLQARLLPVEHEVQIATLGDMAQDMLPSFRRSAPLITEEEVPLLVAAKGRAIADYPDG